MEKRKVVFTESRDIEIKETDAKGQLQHIKHRVVDRKINVKPDMVIFNGRVYWDYTNIMRYAFETGQEVLMRKEDA